MTKFTISRNKLYAALMRCKLAFNSKFLLRINYSFVLQEGILTVCGIGVDLCVCESLETEDLVTPPNAKFATPRSYLLNAIKALDEQPLCFEVLDYQIKVTHSRGSFFLPKDEADEKIKIKRHISSCLKDVEPETRSVELEIPGIKHWIDLCKDSMAIDELRPAMNCVCMDFKATGTLKVAASDGHQLVVVEKEMAEVDYDAKLLLPRDVCTIIQRALPRTGMLSLQFTEEKPEINQKAAGMFNVQLSDDDPTHKLHVWFTYLAMGSRYPNYESVIPSHFNYVVECERKELLKSVNRLSLFAPTTSRALVFNVKQDKMEISTQDSDMEVSANEELPCSLQCPDAGPQTLRIGYQCNHLASLLKRLPGDKISLSMEDGWRPGIFAPVPQPNVEKLTFLLMPMFLT